MRGKRVAAASIQLSHTVINSKSPDQIAFNRKCIKSHDHELLPTMRPNHRYDSRTRDHGSSSHHRHSGNSIHNRNDDPSSLRRDRELVWDS